MNLFYTTPVILLILSLLPEFEMTSPVGVATIPSQLLNLKSFNTNILQGSTFGTVPATGVSEGYNMPQTFTMHTFNAFGETIGDDFAILNCYSLTSNVVTTLTVQLKGGTVVIKENNNELLNKNTGWQYYHAGFTRNSNNIYVFIQNFQTMENYWNVVQHNCQGVKSVTFSKDSTTRFLNGWLDGVDPRRMELLGMANEGNSDGVLKLFFDKGWKSKTAWEASDANYVYKDWTWGTADEFIVHNYRAEYSINGTHFSRQQFVRFYLNDTSAVINRFVIFVKVRVLRGATNWLKIYSYNYTDEEYKQKILVSFNSLGQIIVNYFDIKQIIEPQYEEDELLDLAIGFNGISGGTKTRMLVNINTSYVEDYENVTPNGHGEVYDPEDSNMYIFDTPLEEIYKPMIYLANTNVRDGQLKIYEFQLRESGMIGQTYGFQGGCGASWIGIGGTDGTVQDNSSPCLKCVPSYFKKIDEQCYTLAECQSSGVWNSIDTRLCMTCRSECECSQESPCSKCASSTPGIMKNGLCNPCTSGCLECADDQSVCTKCPASEYLEEGKCVDECNPLSHYILGGDNQVCARCHENCQGCFPPDLINSVPTNEQCKYCNYTKAFITQGSSGLVCESRVSADYLNLGAFRYSEETKKSVQILTTHFTQYVYPHLPPLTLPILPQKMILKLSPVIYFSGYMAIMPPPTYVLPDHDNILFTLTTEYYWYKMQIILKISGTTTDRQCTFIGRLGGTKDIKTEILGSTVDVEFAVRPCNDLKGIRNWFYLGFGIDVKAGAFRGGIAGELGGASFVSSKFEAGITVIKEPGNSNQDPENVIDKSFDAIENTVSFGGEIEASGTYGEHEGIAYKLKNWEMTDFFGTGEDWERALSVWGEESLIYQHSVNEEDMWMKDYTTGDFDQFPFGEGSPDRVYAYTKNGNQQIQKSFWAYGAYVFDEPPSIGAIYSFSELSWHYGANFVISFWHKTPDTFPGSTPAWFTLIKWYPKNDTEATVVDYDPPQANETSKGPALNLYMGYASSQFIFIMELVKPDETKSKITQNIDSDKWNHYAVEYYRMMGSKNVEFRLYYNGVYHSSIISAGGFGLNKNFYVQRKFIFQISQNEDLSAVSPDPIIRPAYGHMRNITMLSHTAVHQSCPQGCLICSTNLFCLYMNPLITSKVNYAGRVYDTCPSGYVAENQVCLPLKRKRVATYENVVSAQVLSSSGNEDTRFVLDTTAGIGVLHFVSTTPPPPSSGGTTTQPLDKVRIKMKLHSANTYHTEAFFMYRHNQPSSLWEEYGKFHSRLPMNKDSTPLTISLISSNSVTFEYEWEISLKAGVDYASQGGDALTPADELGSDLWVYFYVEEFDKSCDNGYAYEGTKKLCESDGEVIRKEFKKIKCHESCPKNCYGESKSKYNCRECSQGFNTEHYYNTDTETEIICQELYDADQISSAINNDNPVNFKWKNIDCHYHSIFKIPGYLMPTYDYELPNWKCETNMDTSNKIGVTKVNSLLYNQADLGSHTYGSYECLIDCKYYPYLQLYSNLCKDYDAIGVNASKNKFNCCQYRRSSGTGQCLVSCFDTPGLYPKDAHTCDSCSDGRPHVYQIDVYGNPTYTWECKDLTVADPPTCKFPHQILDPLDNVSRKTVYCYDCPQKNYYPIIVANTPFGFQCKYCEYIHESDEDLGTTEEQTYSSLPVVCLNKCNVAPKFKYNSAEYRCEACSNSNEFYDANPTSGVAGCVITERGKTNVDDCDTTGAGTGRGKNTNIKYCSVCSDPLVSNTDECKEQCETGQYQLILSGQIQCVYTCPNEMYANTTAIPIRCDLCSAEGYFILNGNCVAGTCPAGQYKSFEDYTCQNCHSNCKTCVGPGEVGCKTCYDGYSLDKPVFPTSIINGTGLRCVKCDVVCNECEKSYYKACKKCLQPYFPYQKFSNDVVSEAGDRGARPVDAHQHPTTLKFCTLNRCEPGFVLSSTSTNTYTPTPGELQCVTCNVPYPKCSLCTFETCSLCETGFFPLPSADSSDPSGYLVKECRPCGYNAGTLSAHPMLALDSESSACIGKCGDGVRLSPENFSLYGVTLEECDDGGVEDGDGCSSECKVEPGWKCSGGKWNSPDSCERITGVEVEVGAVLSKFSDDAVKSNKYKSFEITKGKDFIVILEFNEKMVLQQNQLANIIGCEIESLELATDFTYTLEYDSTGKKLVLIRVTPSFSISNKIITIKFQNTELVSEDGRFLLTTKLETTIHKFVVDSIMDKIISNFLKYGKQLFFPTAALIIGLFNISNLHSYFGSLFEALSILLIPVKLDPVTIKDTKEILTPLITYDFFGVLKETSSNSSRLLSDEDGTKLDERYLNVGINNILIVNMIFHIAICTVAIIMMFILKLVISAHSTKGTINNIVEKAMKGTDKNDLNQEDGVALKVEKKEDNELIDKLDALYHYMNMAGLLNLVRFVFPQVTFLGFLFIRYYKKELGLLSIIFPLSVLLFSLIIMAQLYLIGSYKLVGDRSYGEKEKFDELTMKAQLEQDRVRMMKEVHKKKDKGGKNNNSLSTSKLGGKSKLDDSTLEGLTAMEKQKIEKDKKLNRELELEKDFNLAHDKMDKKREMEIKMRKLKKDWDIDYEKEIRHYNPKYSSMFGEMKFQLLNARLFPFMQMMVTAMYVMVIAIMDSSPVSQTLILMVLQGAICLYTSMKKPYIKNYDNMRVIIDKIINLVITIVFFVFAVNENQSFIGNYTKVRLLERGFLMLLIIGKLVTSFGFFMNKTWKDTQKRRKKKQEKKALERQKSLLVKKNKQDKLGESAISIDKDVTIGDSGEGAGLNKKVKIKRKMNAKQRRKQERKRLKRDMAERKIKRDYDKKGRRRVRDERKEDVIFEGLEIKMQEWSSMGIKNGKLQSIAKLDNH